MLELANYCQKNGLSSVISKRKEILFVCLLLFVFNNVLSCILPLICVEFMCKQLHSLSLHIVRLDCMVSLILL